MRTVGFIGALATLFALSTPALAESPFTYTWPTFGITLTLPHKNNIGPGIFGDIVVEDHLAGGTLDVYAGPARGKNLDAYVADLNTRLNGKLAGDAGFKIDGQPVAKLFLPPSTGHPGDQFVEKYIAVHNDRAVTLTLYIHGDRQDLLQARTELAALAATIHLSTPESPLDHLHEFTGEPFGYGDGPFTMKVDGPDWLRIGRWAKDGVLLSTIDPTTDTVPFAIRIACVRGNPGISTAGFTQSYAKALKEKSHRAEIPTWTPLSDGSPILLTQPLHLDPDAKGPSVIRTAVIPTGPGRFACFDFVITDPIEKHAEAYSDFCERFLQKLQLKLPTQGSASAN